MRIITNTEGLYDKLGEALERPFDTNECRLNAVKETIEEFSEVAPDGSVLTGSGEAVAVDAEAGEPVNTVADEEIAPEAAAETQEAPQEETAAATPEAEVKSEGEVANTDEAPAAQDTETANQAA
jgi:hypothetical protein